MGWPRYTGLPPLCYPKSPPALPPYLPRRKSSGAIRFRLFWGGGESAVDVSREKAPSVVALGNTCNFNT